MYLGSTFFSSNQIVHKILFSLCFWAPDSLIDNFRPPSGMAVSRSYPRHFFRFCEEKSILPPFFFQCIFFYLKRRNLFYLFKHGLTRLNSAKIGSTCLNLPQIGSNWLNLAELSSTWLNLA